MFEVDLRRITNPRWWAANGRSEASELARVFGELGDDEGAAKAWHLLGKAHSDRGEQAAAQEAFEHALECARRAGAPGGRGVGSLLAPAGGRPRADAVPRGDRARRATTSRGPAGRATARSRAACSPGTARCSPGPGRIAEAQDAFAEARRLFDDLGRASHPAYMSMSTAAVEPLASDPAGAEAELRAPTTSSARSAPQHIVATVGPMLAAALVPPGAADGGAGADRGGGADRRPGRPRRQVKWRQARAAALAAAGDGDRPSASARRGRARRADRQRAPARRRARWAGRRVGRGGRDRRRGRARGSRRRALRGQGRHRLGPRWQAKVERLTEAEA